MNSERDHASASEKRNSTAGSVSSRAVKPGPNSIRGLFRGTALTLGARPREQRLNFTKLGNELLFLVHNTRLR